MDDKEIAILAEGHINVILDAIPALIMKEFHKINALKVDKNTKQSIADALLLNSAIGYSINIIRLLKERYSEETDIYDIVPAFLETLTSRLNQLFKKEKP